MIECSKSDGGKIGLHNCRSGCGDPIFDKDQKHGGFNKHGHYQFGSHTCPGCKSDDTQKRKDGLLTCLVCNFVFPI